MTTKGALFVGWGSLIPGREAAGRAVLHESLAHLQQLKDRGRVDSFEPVALAPHGGDLAGFVLVRGSQDDIVALQFSEEFTRLTTRIQRVHTGVGAVTAYVGPELGAYFALWDEPLGTQT